MAIFGPGGTPPDAYLFVDGHYFLSNYRDVTGAIYGEPGEIEPRNVLAVLDGHGPFRIQKGFLYDAVADLTPEEAENSPARAEMVAAKESLHKRWRASRGMHVIQGTSVRREGRRTNFEEKEVDILLAVDALEYAARGVIRYVVLVAADRDYVPLVEALLRFGVYVKVASFAWKTQSNLFEAADERQVIDVQDIWEFGTETSRATSQRLFRAGISPEFLEVGQFRLERASIRLLAKPERDWFAVYDERDAHIISSMDARALERYVEFRYRQSVTFG